jgi:hypothetical protein
MKKTYRLLGEKREMETWEGLWEGAFGRAFGALGPEKKSGGPSIIKSKKKPEDPNPKEKKDLHPQNQKKSRA